MTEAEWLVCDDPGPMLETLLGKTSDRRLRRFAVECCRRVCEHLIDPRCLRALESIEENVGRSRDDTCCRAAADDVRAVRKERLTHLYASFVSAELAQQAADDGIWGLIDEATAVQAVAKAESDPICSAACAVWVAAGAGRTFEDDDTLIGSAEVSAIHAASACGNGTSERRLQAQLVRDIFGNPFRTVTADPSWRASTVVALASHMYDSRDFSAMPILADALQDAGCTNEAILTHCRAAELHVRGCWVVDMVIGKG
ncbi:hypothetical protein R5W23_001258 [Gemmata sp. JC673]|uniref:Uncharacterized protein n=1 Tax=Gemmata algarum TaxID=2975278 RepID=A0ABU5EXM1_9BACT|nr:hypothetical protein [Gemmata algarum]MDY3560035.1 hypothetical protein [Gemmata algarum]